MSLPDFWTIKSIESFSFEFEIGAPHQKQPWLDISPPQLCICRPQGYWILCQPHLLLLTGGVGIPPRDHRPRDLLAQPLDHRPADPLGWAPTLHRGIDPNFGPFLTHIHQEAGRHLAERKDGRDMKGTRGSIRLLYLYIYIHNIHIQYIYRERERAGRHGGWSCES